MLCIQKYDIKRASEFSEAFKNAVQPQIKFLVKLFSKSLRSPEAEPLVALRRERNSPAFYKGKIGAWGKYPVGLLSPF